MMEFTSFIDDDADDLALLHDEVIHARNSDHEPCIVRHHFLTNLMNVIRNDYNGDE